MNREEKYYLLANPFTLISLIILILNDHILKQYFPGFISGKLSDFAGLFIFPVFIYVLCGKYFKQKYSIEIIIILSGLLFTALEFEPADELIVYLFNKVHLPEPNLTADYQDLSALIVLPLSLLLVKKYKPGNPPVFRKYIYISLLIVYSSSIIATSYLEEYVIKPEKNYSHIQGNEKLLFIFESVLLEEKIEISSRFKVDEKFIYNISFNQEFIDINNLNVTLANGVHGTIEFSPSLNKDSLILREIYLYAFNPVNLSDTLNKIPIGERIIRKFILVPFEKKLEQFKNEN